MRRGLYWLGWALAALGYLALIADLLLMAFIDTYPALIIRVIHGDGEGWLRLALAVYVAVAALLLTLED